MKIVLQIKDWLIIQWKMVLITILSIIFLENPVALFQTLLVIAGLELFALQIYEYIIRFIFSNSFLLDKFNGEDTKFSIMETAGLSTFQAAALLSSHILVSIVAYGVYFIQFAP